MADPYRQRCHKPTVDRIQQASIRAISRLLNPRREPERELRRKLIFREELDARTWPAYTLLPLRDFASTDAWVLGSSGELTLAALMFRNGGILSESEVEPPCEFFSFS